MRTGKKKDGEEVDGGSVRAEGGREEGEWRGGEKLKPKTGEHNMIVSKER